MENKNNLSLKSDVTGSYEKTCIPFL